MEKEEKLEERRRKLAAFYARRGRMPSYRELMSLLGYRSKNAVDYFLRKLIDAGIVEKDEQGKLIPKRLQPAPRILGLVEAGFPSAAEEELLDVMDFDEYLVPNKESSYILRVKGDSMKDAGIMPGDMVIVERRAVYKPGQIVIAMIDGEYTMKFLRRSTGSTPSTSSGQASSPQAKQTAGKKEPQYFLEPANEKYKPIYPREAFRVEAVVTGVVRKY